MKKVLFFVVILFSFITTTFASNDNDKIELYVAQDYVILSTDVDFADLKDFINDIVPKSMKQACKKELMTFQERFPHAEIFEKEYDFGMIQIHSHETSISYHGYQICISITPQQIHELLQ